MTRRFPKKRYSYIIVRIITIILILYLFTFPISAWDNCPFGEINEPFPGTCGRYTDSDVDNICDLSQPPPEVRFNTEEQETTNQNNGNNTIKSQSSETNARLNYYFIPIALALFVLYLMTFFLSKRKKIKLVKHRKIWNFLLLGTFLISGLFGIILAITISYGIRLSFYANILFWHVEFGIAMAMISIFHIGWHWRYYIKMVSTKGK